MSGQLSWAQSETTLVISGILDRDSILGFWEKRQSLLSHIESIDVSNLSHVDSTGLAMLVRLKGEYQSQQRPLKFVGISDNLNTLIELYGVKAFLIN
ncbi:MULTISPECIES: lipid asymmetry maintenance protein MlaB [Providencia]|uniref:lipid asymmetry maintenance protein MlaB n=1 Tax=Providencia TaxID=586 RepID=UPI0012B623F7|nr:MULTISPECIES: lipid asymmetry maintenance protein MlaB [Providencia]MTC56560.1 lipid asymmetry maintenance protein MlaB [Providencia rustigianii]